MKPTHKVGFLFYIFISKINIIVGQFDIKKIK